MYRRVSMLSDIPMYLPGLDLYELFALGRKPLVSVKIRLVLE